MDGWKYCGDSCVGDRSEWSTPRSVILWIARPWKFASRDHIRYTQNLRSLDSVADFNFKFPIPDWHHVWDDGELVRQASWSVPSRDTTWGTIGGKLVGCYMLHHKCPSHKCPNHISTIIMGFQFLRFEMLHELKGKTEIEWNNKFSEKNGTFSTVRTPPDQIPSDWIPFISGDQVPDQWLKSR